MDRNLKTEPDVNGTDSVKGTVKLGAQRSAREQWGGYKISTSSFLQMNKETKLRIHNITAKAALKFGNEAWVLKKREEQRIEAAQMKFLRHILGITKLDKEKNQCIRRKKREQRT